MSFLLEAIDLEIAYGDVAACSGISFTVSEKEIVTLIGSNGAGKSTTMRAIAGAMYARKGKVLFEGEDITHMPSYQRNQLGIALVPEGRHVFPFLTVLENLEMGGYCHRNNRPKMNTLIEKMYSMFPRLKERSKQNAGTLSGGEQQMLVICRALMSEPKLLCLDEPSLGLAPIIVQDIFRTIREINASNTSVLLVEQNAHYALSTASRAYVLQTGKILTSGKSSNLINDPKIKEAYLGSN